VGTASPRYPQEFRRKAVGMARRGDRTQEDIAKELGTSPRQLRRWIRQVEADEAMRDALSSGDVPPEVLEARRMKRKIAQLEEANRALLEANRFFAARRRH
jgi:transposase-like protein